MSGKSVKKNYIYNLAYQILLLITPFITTPYVSRVLGADGVGLNSYTNSIVSYFILIAVLGTNDYGQREIAYRQDDIKERSIMFWEVFLLRAVTCIFSLCLFTALTWRSEYRILYLLQSVHILAVIVDISWFFQGMEEFGKIITRNAFAKLLNVILIFMFVKGKEDLPFYIASISFSVFIGHLSAWHFLSGFLCPVTFKDIKILKNVKQVLQLFFPQIAIQVSAVMDKTMLGFITGSDFENGYYEQADRIEKICLTLVSSLGVVMIPRISHIIAQKKEELLQEYIYRSYRFIWFLALPMTFGLFGISELFVPWFFGAGYEKTITLVRLFSFLLCIVGISSVTGVQYFIPAGKQNQFTLSVVLGLIVNFLMNAVLIDKYLSVGAAVATLAGEATVTVSQLVMVRWDFSIRRILKLSLSYLVAASCMLLWLWLLKQRLTAGTAELFVLVCSGAAVYMLALALMRDEMLMEGIELLKRKRRSIWKH